MGISFGQKGDFSRTSRFLKELEQVSQKERLVMERYGKMGVDALSAATPERTGKTASSWTYEVSTSGTTTSIEFKNTNVNRGVNIAIILQYGHGTRNGGYVQGRDYINPAIRPVFDRIAEEAWREVNK